MVALGIGFPPNRLSPYIMVRLGALDANPPAAAVGARGGR
jgi:hypothetical protein